MSQNHNHTVPIDDQWLIEMFFTKEHASMFPEDLVAFAGERAEIDLTAATSDCSQAITAADSSALVVTFRNASRCDPGCGFREVEGDPTFVHISGWPRMLPAGYMDERQNRTQHLWDYALKSRTRSPCVLRGCLHFLSLWRDMGFSPSFIPNSSLESLKLSASQNRPPR